ncbi:MAG TPA: S41 family peptidase [Lacipirellulaceae bacterium]|nr:S41 family peptidase [Lacipirellulaceae bacterium]
MYMRLVGTFVVYIAASWSFGALAAPPKVVKAVPDNGAVNVDPNLKEIRITFDQPMGKGMSVVGGGDEFPQVQGRPTWVNDRTIVVRVKLQPRHAYWLSINNETFKNFTNPNGESAVPYPIKFRTGTAESVKGHDSTSGGKPERTTNRHAVELMRTAIRDHYSYRDRLSIDWDDLLETNEAALTDTKTPTGFAQVAATLLTQAKDKHIWLKVGDEIIPTYVNPPVPNANYKLLPKLIPNFKKHGRLVASGRWSDGIGYIAITTWDRDKLEGGAPVFGALKDVADTSALIIDVRINGGGAEPLAQEFAGCFTSEPRLYAQDVYRDPNSNTGFTQPKERWLQPNRNYPKYKGRVAVLSGPAVMSSCESFLLMMKQVPRTITVGARSQGSSGNPKPHDLGNGVTLYLPSWKDLTADGRELEGVGIAPDIEVNTSAGDFQNADPVLDTALEKLRVGKGK